MNFLKTILIILMSGFTLLVQAQAQKNLQLYTDRPTARLQPIADQFFQKTGIKVHITELAFKDLLLKLQTEGANSPADLIFTKDLVFQSELANLGWYQPMKSELAKNVVASHMRHPLDLWTAVTYRVRSLVYSINSDVSSLNTYEDLAHVKWAGRLCVRTSANSYNEALISSFLATYGSVRTSTLLQGWVENFSVAPLKSDTAVLEAIANGQCEVGIANSYYLAQILSQNPSFPVRMKFLDQDTQGVHVNGSGIGVAVTSKNVDESSKFIDFLLSDEAQLNLSTALFEYPTATHLLPSTLIREWGNFKSSALNWNGIGQFVPESKELVKQVGYK